MAVQDVNGYYLLAFMSIGAGLLALIFHTESSLISFLMYLNEYLEGAYFYLLFFPSTLLKISLLDLAGSILVCLKYRSDMMKHHQQKSWLETLVACTLYQFGGK